MAQKPQIIIIGAGFGGLIAAQNLAKADVEVTIIDRNNFHTFTPLLYQVATCALDSSSVAYPVRSIFRDHHNVHFLLGEVTEINHQERCVTVQSGETSYQKWYDYLIIAVGSVTNFFGSKETEEIAFGLKSAADAVRLRHHILRCFERAAWAADEQERDALTTLVAVGGGPVGLETAGALHELYNYVLKQEYDDRMPRLRARVILLEATDKLLAPYPEALQKSAVKQLESLGVEVMFNAMVTHVEPDRITLKDGRIIRTHTLIWSAGVKASPLAEKLDVTLAERTERIPVEPTMQVIGRPHIYAIGDVAHLLDEKGQPYPMLIPAAMQQGELSAKNILCEIANQPLAPFHYNDKGIMATIGRRRAVAWLYYKVQLSGYLAWIVWLVFHLISLLGFRNRVVTFASWVWNYFTYDRSVRIILDSEIVPRPNPATPGSLQLESAAAGDGVKA
jgi:NADH:ubiquinone reductase (H+-translocating)